MTNTRKRSQRVQQANKQGTQKNATRQSKSHRKTMRDGRKQGASYFKVLVENSDDAIAFVSPDLSLLHVNLAAQRLLGYSRAELSRMRWTEVLHDKDSARVKRAFHQLMVGTKRKVSDTFQIRHKKNVWRTVEIHATNHLDDPHINAIIVSGRDVTEQHNAELGLIESEARYRLLVERSPEAIAILDNGVFLYVNPAGARLIGAKTPEELVGRSVADFVHPESRDTVCQQFRCTDQQSAQGSPNRGRIVRLDGTYADVEFVAIPISFRSKHAVQIVVRDLTEEKRSKQNLEHRDAILEAVGYAAEQFLKSGSWQQSIQDVLMRLGTIMDVSRASIFEKDFSSDGKQFVRIRFEWAGAGIVSQVGNPVLQNFEEMGSGIDRWFGRMNEGEFIKGLTKDFPLTEQEFLATQGIVSIAAVPIAVGNSTWGFISFADCRTERPWSDAELYALRFAADILGAAIERQKFEHALVSSEQKYRMLFEESRDGVYISTPEGKFIDMNLAGVQILGFRTREEVLALDIERDLYVEGSERARFQHAIEEQGFVKDYEQNIKCADGQKITMLETASAVRNTTGTIVMYRGIFRDVTKQRQLEQDLIQVQKMESLGTLAAGIAHDFNNILSIILVYNSLIKKIIDDPAKLSQSVTAIHAAVERGAELVKQILTFARKTEVHVGPLDVNLTLKDIAMMLQETFPKTITLSVKPSENIPFITADASQIHQVILNLCVNARDAMSSGGLLSLATEIVSGHSLRNKHSEASASEYVHIKVADTGTGMDESTKQHIFDPFFTTKEKGKGTGLGLSVVYGAVKNHNGFIQVESEPSRGSTFHLYFPIPSKSTRLEHRDLSTQGDIPGGSETLLIVEDEDAIRDTIVELFEEKGYTVVSARDGVEALEIFRKKKDEIRLVLSDLGLPKLSGDQVLFEIKALNPSVKIILASGYFEPETKNELIAAGAREFIQKPYTPEEILRKVRLVIDS